MIYDQAIGAVVRVEGAVVVVIYIRAAKINVCALPPKKIHSESVTALPGKGRCPIYPGRPGFMGQRTFLHPLHPLGVGGIEWSICQIAIGLEAVGKEHTC